MEKADKSNAVEELYQIQDLIDLEALRRIFEKFTNATGFTIGFLGHPEMNVLLSSGWRKVCSDFHDSHPVSLANCLRKNQSFVNQLDDPTNVVIESCENGLVDCAIPVIVNGRHIATLVTGQLFVEKPDIRKFRKQARALGFAEKEYIAEIKNIPVVSEDHLKEITEFLGEMARYISRQGYTNLCLKEKAMLLEEEVFRRKVIEKGNLQSKEKYRFLVESMTDAVWTTDLELTINYISNSIEKILGYTPEEIKLIPPEKLIKKDSLRFLKDVLKERIASEKSLSEKNDQPILLEIEEICKDGTVKWIECKAKPIRAPSDEIVGVFGVSRDISLRKKAEEERKVLQERLSIAQKMESLGRLAGGVAHDFNNLLTVIQGHSGIALQELSPDDHFFDSFEQIQKAATDSAALTRQLLAFARKQVVKARVLNLNDTVESMLKMLTRLIGEQIELLWKPCSSLWSCKVDPGQIDQILANLCVNSKDSIAGIGRITIESNNLVMDRDFCSSRGFGIPGDYVVLSVLDNGCGIEEEYIEHVFEPFFTTKDSGFGTGLGLATVYGIAKQNGGFAELRSRVGKGTCLNVYLPRSLELETESELKAPTQVPHGNGETIMLVEDEDVVLETTRVLLEKLGYRVFTAGLPRDAIRFLKGFDGQIHLLLTDLIMPEMNGRELGALLARIKPEMKVLYMSGYSADIIAGHDVSKAGLLFLQKPFSIAELAGKVKEALEKKAE